MSASPTTLAEALRKKAQRRRKSLETAGRMPVILPRNDLVPPLELQQRRPGDLFAPARNVREVAEGHVDEVVRSVQSLGFCAPVLIDAQGHVLDGWVRVVAARRLRLETIPCIVADHLKPSEKRLLRLALNRLGEKGQWDVDALRLEVQDLILEETPIEIAGFSAQEIDLLLIDEEASGHEDGPLEPDRQAEPRMKRGDIVRLGAHRLACGDARDADLLARLMAGRTARIVLTDVPYNVPIRGHVTGQGHREFAMASGEMSPQEFQDFNTAWIAAAARHLIDGGLLGTFIDWRGLSSVQAGAKAGGLDEINLIVWTKTNAGMGSLYRSAHELLPLYKKGTAGHINNVELGKHGRWRSNVWTYPGASSQSSEARRGLKDHPTVKPTAMIADALVDLTMRDEIVLDPFLGSGSTLVAAHRTGRICHGVEIDPAYCDLAIRRWEAETGGRAEWERATDQGSEASHPTRK